MRITADRPSIKIWNQTVTFLWIETRLYYFFRNGSIGSFLLLLLMKLPKERKKACNKYLALDPTVELKSESPRKKSVTCRQLYFESCHFVEREFLLPGLMWFLGALKAHTTLVSAENLPYLHLQLRVSMVCVWHKDPPHQSLLMEGGRGAPQSLILFIHL